MRAHCKLIAFGAALMLAMPVTAAAQDKPVGCDTAVLNNGTRGAVTLTHKAHSTRTECVTCHHASKPEKEKTAEFQKCSSCHTKPATEPMKTGLRDAFHNGIAKAGTCIDCHAKEVAAGKTAPVKCAECHASVAK